MKHRGHLIDEGGEHDKRAISLETRRGSYIRNQRRDEWSDEDLREAKRKFAESHPKAKFRTISATYNCVGMVFANRRTWVEPEYVNKFLEEDEYRKLLNREIPELGDVIIYKQFVEEQQEEEIVHIGIIIELESNLKDGTYKYRVLSKWGQYSEYIHDPDYVLENFGSPTEIWTDRKQL